MSASPPKLDDILGIVGPKFVIDGPAYAALACTSKSVRNCLEYIPLDLEINKDMRVELGFGDDSVSGLGEKTFEITHQLRGSLRSMKISDVDFLGDFVAPEQLLFPKYPKLTSLSIGCVYKFKDHSTIYSTSRAGGDRALPLQLFCDLDADGQCQPNMKLESFTASQANLYLPEAVPFCDVFGALVNVELHDLAISTGVLKFPKTLKRLTLSVLSNRLPYDEYREDEIMLEVESDLDLLHLTAKQWYPKDGYTHSSITMKKSPKRIKHLHVVQDYFPASLTSFVEKLTFLPHGLIPTVLPKGLKQVRMNSQVWRAAIEGKGVGKGRGRGYFPVTFSSDFFPQSVEELHVEDNMLSQSFPAAWGPIRKLPNLRVFSWPCQDPKYLKRTCKDPAIVIPGSIKALMPQDAYHPM